MPRHSQIVVYVHLVWGTWDRLPLITPQIEREIQRVIGAKCVELDGEIIAIGGVSDHVHVLVGLPATVTIANLVGQMKGSSSHTVTHDIYKDGRFFKWQGAYGAFSVSPDGVPQVCDYIHHQKEHHANAELIAAWEFPPDDDE